MIFKKFSTNGLITSFIKQLLFDPDPSATVFVGQFFVWLCVLGGFYTSGKEFRFFKTILNIFTKHNLVSLPNFLCC